MNVQKFNFEQSGNFAGSLQQDIYLSGPPDKNISKVELSCGNELIDGRFIISQRVGVGRLCDVYQALDNEMGQEIALKIVTLRPVGKNSVEELIKNELKINSCISDKTHVLNAYDFFSCCYKGSRLVMLSMEYANGASLRDWLRANIANKRIRQTEGINIFRQICQGLLSIHKNNICHLDLKPENILFVNGSVKVADFGLSGFRYGSLYSANAGQLSHNQLGTAVYMSPEQFVTPHIMNLDLRSDIYSLGVILYEIIHPQCKPPFEGTYENLQYQHLQSQVCEVEIENENIKKVLCRALEKKPKDRYESITELLEDLDGRLEQQCSENDNQQDTQQEDDNEQTIARLWEQTLLCVKIPDFNNTILICKAILQLDPEHERASLVFEDLKERFQAAHNYYAYVEENIIREPVEKLAQILCKAVSIYPDHPDGPAVQARLLEMSNNKVQRLLSRCDAIIRDRRHRAAQANRNTARTSTSMTNDRTSVYGTYRPASSGISSARQMRPFAVRKKSYQKLWDYIKSFF